MGISGHKYGATRGLCAAPSLKAGTRVWLRTSLMLLLTRTSVS